MDGWDASLRWLVPPPSLTDPVLVVMMTGWIDAGGAARSAAEAMEDDIGASPIAEFDDDVYIDYRARRPVMELREGLNSLLNWERIALRSDATRQAVTYCCSAAPSPTWRGTASRIWSATWRPGSVCATWPISAPTRSPLPTRARCALSITSPSQDVLMRLPFLRSSIDVPAGAAAALEHELHARGIPTVGIWAQVPHYIASITYPAASVALLDGLREATGLVVDAATLRSEVMIQGRRIDALVAGNDEHAAMIEQLEQIYDEIGDEAGTVITTNLDNGPRLEVRSADELAPKSKNSFENRTDHWVRYGRRMKVDAVLTVGLKEAGEAARQLEDEGYSGIWSVEAGHDPFLPLMLAAEHTSEVELGTSIAVAFARNPMLLAHDRVGPPGVLGRSLHPRAREPDQAPHHQALLDAVEPSGAPHAGVDPRGASHLGLLVNGTKLEFRGEFYTHTLMTPFFAPDPTDLSGTGVPKVFLAGVGELMTEVAGEVCDGFICHGFSTERYLREVTLPALERGRAKAGKTLDGFEIVGPSFVVTGGTEEGWPPRPPAPASRSLSTAPRRPTAACSSARLGRVAGRTQRAVQAGQVGRDGRR